MSLAKLLKCDARLGSAKERLHVRSGEVEDSCTVPLGVFVPTVVVLFRMWRESEREREEIGE
jgi:hypothetical protein